MAHQIIEDLNWRYTTKAYDESKTISTEDIDVIKEALRLSASSINSQPWKFIIIESEEAKQRLAEAFATVPFNQPHATKASHTILLAHKTHFNKDDYTRRVDVEVSSGHLPAERHESMMGAMAFADMVTDDTGFNGHWTKAQLYIALGNLLHVLARLRIDSTPMEGVDSAALAQTFAAELGKGYECGLAVAIGYHHSEEDYNHGLPKARLPQDEIITVL